LVQKSPNACDCTLKNIFYFCLLTLRANLVPRSPIALGYTRGHFCALVPPEPDPGCGGGAGGGAAPPPAPQCCYLPLVGRDLSPLPLHFLSRCELGREEELLKQWLDVGLTESGRCILML